MPRCRVIKVSVRSNADKIARQILKASAALQNFEEPNRLLSIALYSWTIRNFNSQGRVGSFTVQQRGAVPWAPLAASTVKRKKKLGKTQPLVITGNLRQSFAPFYDGRSAGVGAQASAFAGPRGDYALYLHEGTKNMPARNLLPTQDIGNAIGFKVYGVHLANVARIAENR